MTVLTKSTEEVTKHIDKNTQGMLLVNAFWYK